MSQQAPGHAERAGALVQRLLAAVQRLLARPDGPLALALALALTALIEVSAYADHADVSTLPNLLATLPLALVRRHLPGAATIVTLGSLTALVDSAGTLTVSGLLALLVVCFLVGARYPRRWSALLVSPWLLNVLAPFAGDAGISELLMLVLVVAAAALGDAQRLRERVIAERDASREAMAVSQRDQAAMEERARIARELHDVVAHHVSAIAVQAETARLTTPDLPEQGKQRLEAIGETARDALGELRRLLGVLRSDAGGEADRFPQPGMAQLHELIETARTAGSPVRLAMRGRVEPLPPGVDLCAYRIVQEALTNARRHASGAQVEVEIEYATDALRLQVRDHGPGPANGELGGHGLLGMRERVIMVGGTLRTGAADGGGFAVEAVLPLPDAAVR